MLPRPNTDVPIEVITGDYKVGKGGKLSGLIHAKTLMGPRSRAPRARQVLFLHGEALGGNHTLVERPGRWLIARELFDLVILPDRRGSGGSSPLPRPQTLEEHAEDLSGLLDRMNIQAPLVVIGVSSGGPLALTLAAHDPRVTCVVLVAASPTLQPPGAVERFLLRRGWLQAWMARDLRRRLAKQPAPDAGRRDAGESEANFDPAYDARTPQEMTAAFDKALRSIPQERIPSLNFAFFASHDHHLASTPPTLRLDLPVLQVIGQRDELWETGEVSATPPGDLLRRFPHLHRYLVKEGLMHNDVFFRAQAFYDTLCTALLADCDLVKQK